MITLYHRPRSRSTRLIFLLEELGAPYTIQLVSIRTRDGGGALDPANPHPHGKVAVISDDGVVVFESSAMLGRAPYMLGERFSALDVLYGTTFKLFAQSPLLPKTPVIDDYVTRVVARPAFARAMAKQGG
jgi:glutathione S-transferase